MNNIPFLLAKNKMLKHNVNGLSLLPWAKVANAHSGTTQKLTSIVLTEMVNTVKWLDTQVILFQLILSQSKAQSTLEVLL